MKYFQFLIVCLGMLFFYPIFAQNLLKGKIVDEFDQPIENVVVMIDASSRSTKSNTLGEFQIDFPNGQHIVIFRHADFDLQRQSFQSSDLKVVKIILHEKVIELQEATVSVMSPADWNYYYSIFKENFLGINKAAKDCKILNPKILRFHFDAENRVLTATAKDPILIENNHLGYLVEYDLTDFMMDYKNQYLLVIGSSFFQDLKGSKSKHKRWNTNRKIAYNGSFTHFLKAVYHNQIIENGFDVKRYIRQDNPAYQEAVQRMKNGERNVQIPSKMIAYLINQDVPIDSLVQSVENRKFMNFEGLYSVEYKNEKEDLDYVQKVKKGRFVGNQVSLFSLKAPIEITPEGYYMHPGDVILEEYWTWEKFSLLLPIDYKN